MYGPVNAYSSAGGEFATDFGDDLLLAAGVPNQPPLPAGWTAVVDSPPAKGRVELAAPAAYGWRFIANPGATGTDSWMLTVTDPAGSVTRVTVAVELASTD